jgi:soluble lytic murein transglycosylase-like protein
MARILIPLIMLASACGVKAETRHVIVHKYDNKELKRLETEIVKANEDRIALRQRLEQLERQIRTSRARTGVSSGSPPPSPQRSGTCSGWSDLISQYAWDVAVACKVMWCESRGNPNARNGRHVGLFQIANGPFDPAENVALAYSMWSKRGWQPWSASQKCWN